jgi:hypothetical protein
MWAEKEIPAVDVDRSDYCQMKGTKMIYFYFAWPYLVLAIFALVKCRRGMNRHDRAGLMGAAIALLVMSLALWAYPAIFSAITGDYTANIGYGLLVIGSCVYCLAFIWAGNAIGMHLSKRGQNNSAES